MYTLYTHEWNFNYTQGTCWLKKILYQPYSWVNSDSVSVSGHCFESFVFVWMIGTSLQSLDNSLIYDCCCFQLSEVSPKSPNISWIVQLFGFQNILKQGVLSSSSEPTYLDVVLTLEWPCSFSSELWKFPDFLRTVFLLLLPGSRLGRGGERWP